MSMAVQVAPPCQDWIDQLPELAKEEVLAMLLVLEQRGVTLGAPYVSPAESSKYPNEMKRLEFEHAYRLFVIYFFESAEGEFVAAAGGEATGSYGFDEEIAPIADEVFENSN